MFPQDDVMLPGRVRLQHEASLLRTNAVGSPPLFAVIVLPLPPPLPPSSSLSLPPSAPSLP